MWSMWPSGPDLLLETQLHSSLGVITLTSELLPDALTVSS